MKNHRLRPRVCFDLGQCLNAEARRSCLRPGATFIDEMRGGQMAG